MIALWSARQNCSHSVSQKFERILEHIKEAVPAVTNRAHTNGGVQQRTLLRRVLRRVLEIAFEKVLRRVLRRCLAVGLMGRRVLRRVLRRGSKKGLSRRHLEGRSTPFREYDPIGMCPIQGSHSKISENWKCYPQREKTSSQKYLGCTRRGSYSAKGRVYAF